MVKDKSKVTTRSFGVLNLIQQLGELDNEVNAFLRRFDHVEKVEIHDLVGATHGEKSYTITNVPLVRTLVVYFH